MKYIMFAALSLFSLMASANGETSSSTSQSSVQAEQYDYGQDLNIAKVVRLSTPASAATECGPVVAHMVYVDTKGVTHNLQYTRFGDGCNNG